jgi:hypothetical protein
MEEARESGMEEAAFEVWRRHLRTLVFEQIIIQNAFLVQMSAGRLSVDEAERAIIGGLDENLAQADVLFGALLKGPAPTALYRDEVKTVLDQMKEHVSQFATYLRERDF